MYRVVGFFEVLNLVNGWYSVFSQFYFQEWICQNEQLFGAIIFTVVKFHEWSTSAKFVEFTHLLKNQLYSIVCVHLHYA